MRGTPRTDSRRRSHRARHARTGAVKPFAATAPRSSYSNRPPVKRCVLCAITTAPGSARAWRRAARFGVSPTTACSCAAPAPMRSPTTTGPVAMPMRTRSRSGAESCSTASTSGVVSAVPSLAAKSQNSPKVTPVTDELTADEIRTLLKLEPNDTCGFVRVTFASKQSIAAGGLPAPFAEGRPLGSALYFLVTPAAPVRLHRIRNEQLYHYY